MAGVRVYELARDLGISSKNLIEELRNQGIDVKSHMSTMDEETARLVHRPVSSPSDHCRDQYSSNRKSDNALVCRLLRLRHLL